MTEGYEDHRLLPADAPHGQAHILVRDAFPAKGRMLGDYIATFLMNLDKYPDALKDFFDSDVKFFHLVRWYKEGQSHYKSEFMISRKKDRVITGLFHVQDDKQEIVWECVTKTKLSKIGPDAKWKTTWGARQAYSFMPTESIWNSTFIKPNQPFYPNNNPRKAKEANDVARGFGSFLYTHCAWEEDEESEITLKKK